MIRKHLFAVSAVALSLALGAPAWAEIDAYGNQLAKNGGQNADDGGTVADDGTVVDDGNLTGTGNITDGSYNTKNDNDTKTVTTNMSVTKNDNDVVTKNDNDTKNLGSFNTTNLAVTKNDNDNITKNETDDSYNTLTKTEDSYNTFTKNDNDTKTLGSFNTTHLTVTKNDNDTKTVSITKIVADQELKGVIINQKMDTVVDAHNSGGVTTGGNSVSGSSFAAFAGIMNAAWNTGINANSQAATNISAQGNVTFGNADAAP